MEKLDVVVIGAGPVGLATAIGLRKRGVENLLVVDQTRAFRQVGQTVDLLPNGLKALKYLDSVAYEQIKEVGNRFLNPKPPNEETVKTTPGTQPAKATREWVQKNLRGERISSFSLSYDDWFKEYGEGRTSISWYNLQTTLRQLLPEDRVRPNHRCINIEDESETGYIRVDCVSDTRIEANPYAHWSEEQKPEENQPQNGETQQFETKSFRAKLIIAADGINSTVRQILYKDSPYSAFAKPKYSGFAAIACSQIIDIPDNLKSALEESFFQGSPLVTIRNDEISGEDFRREVPRMIMFQRPNGPTGYLIHIALPLDILQGKSGKSLIDIALPALENAGYPDVLKQLVSISTPDNMRQRPYYVHHASITDSLQLPSAASIDTQDNLIKIQPPWSSGRVVLVGDAAHGMPPFIAQGANQGLEDALVIATLIANVATEKGWDNTQAITQAFEKYEHFRRPFMVRVQQATLQQLSPSLKKEWQEYSDLVFRREFAQMLPAIGDK
ncbi:NAD(P)/FAD-dependent oxidoreductase [Scytonema sp. UIC 10036]|uniref:FAD-dependent oxidoreductase n=1 Tax=Scytonema sp. UIC 10036 TaxID=2304196 RepID=UPI001FAAC509|nr:NAD(P)/FAD-dependent oxidoreductase [Scytonema sp. UIC 10036]